MSIIGTGTFDSIIVNFYGSYDNPLFHIGEVSQLFKDDNDINILIANLDRSEVVGDFVTKYGLYSIVFKSKIFPVEKFIKWIEKQMQIHINYEEVQKRGSIYIIKTDAIDAYKVGKTKDVVSKRVKNLQTGNVEKIEILFDYQTSNPDLLERCVHYILDKYRCHSNREFFYCNIHHIKRTVQICCRIIDTLKSCYDRISDDELLTRLKEKNINTDISNLRQTIRTSDTNESSDIQEMDPLNNWLDKNIIYNKGSVLKLQDTVELYTGIKQSPRLLGFYRKQIEKWIKSSALNDLVDNEYKQFWIGDIKFKGWKDIRIREE